MFKIYEKFASSGYDLVKTVKTEKEAIREVKRLKEKYRNYLLFSDCFYNEIKA